MMIRRASMTGCRVRNWGSVAVMCRWIALSAWGVSMLVYMAVASDVNKLAWAGSGGRASSSVFKSSEFLM
jgi:hypothetical protein